jgi:uncharacterized protein YfaP (DUF2135 family)
MKIPFLALLSAACLLLGLGTARADNLPAGDYQFSVPLAPIYLNGTFSGTVDAQPAVFTLRTSAAGAVTGKMTLAGAKYKVKGTFRSPDGVAVTVKLTALSGATQYKLKGKLQNAGQANAALVGTIRTGPAGGDLSADPNPFSLDVSGASPLALGFDFTLNPANAAGVVKGNGSVTINGTATDVVKAKVRIDKASGNAVLTIKNQDLLVIWTGSGPVDSNGVLLAGWTTAAYGAATQGANLSISQSESGAAGEVKTNTITALPALSVNPPVPPGSGSATVRFNVPGATSLTLTASGEGAGSFAAGNTPAGNYTATGDMLTQTATVGDYGSCTLTGTAETASGTQTFTTSFTVRPTKPVLPTVKVDGGTFLLGSLPPKTGSSQDPDITSASAPSLINGGVSQLTTVLADQALLANIRYALIQMQGAGGGTGYFRAPVVVQNNAATVNLRLDSTAQPAGGTSAASRARTRALAKGSNGAAAARVANSGPHTKSAHNPTLPRPLDNTGDLIQVTIELVDANGDVGSSQTVTLNTREVSTGNVQVSLSWDTPTDLDLHVVDPTGAEVYYGNTSVASGGTLDLDSNPGCNIDGINNENVTWTNDAPYGQYTVRVDFYDGCDDPTNGIFNGANYVVTVNVDGVKQTYQGSFAADTFDQGGAGSGVTVATFTRTPSYRVSGTAMYEDFAPTNTGLSTSSTMLPIRFAQVDVCRASDDAVLATGALDQDGAYDLTFQNTGAPGYYVRVSTQQDSDALKETVIDNGNNVYQAKSDVINETVTPEETDLEVDAMASDNTGPAFNIFDCGVTGNLTVLAATGQNMPMLTWLWTKGSAGTCSGAVSCYSSANDTISVLSTASDSDEYDDTVLLHEYGHFFQAKLSKDNSPGGFHSLSQRVAPTLAWSEGSASFFACYAAGSPVYIDTNSTGVGVRFSVETQDKSVPVGTSTGDQNGNLSEEVVSAVLWDLADAANETGDTITDPAGVFTALLGLKTSASDRGVAGADLVDFLDLYYSANLINKGDDTSGIQGNLKLNGFPYDFTP